MESMFEKLADGVWVYEEPLKLAGILLGHRMTHSPVAERRAVGALAGGIDSGNPKMYR